MRAAATGCAGAALVLLTSCAGSNPPAATSPGTPRPASSASAAVNPVALVSAASGKTLAKQSSRVATTVTSSNGLRLQSTGACDFRRRNAVFQLTTTTSGRTSKQRIILVGGVAYLTMPGLGPGARYVKLDLTALTGRSGGSSFDQSTQLSMLRGATDSLHPVGSDTVRGVRTTHLVGTLDQGKALAALTDPGQRAALRKLTSVVKLPNRIPVELWIDSAGLLRRMKQQVDVAAQQVAGVSVPAAAVTTISEFYDFGVPVNAVRPPASAILG